MTSENLSAQVSVNKTPAGILERKGGVYFFSYLPEYLSDSEAPALSLTLPKRSDIFTSPFLFPFFFGLLVEGENKSIVCRQLKIDEKDYFSILLKTAGEDTIGAVTVKELNDE